MWRRSAYPQPERREKFSGRHGLIFSGAQGNFIEFENIVGEPLREAQRLGVATPTLAVIYGLLKTIQWRTRQRKGMVEVPLERPADLDLS